MGSFLQGGKKISRTAKYGHECEFSEDAILMIYECDKPARTMLTSEG